MTQINNSGASGKVLTGLLDLPAGNPKLFLVILLKCQIFVSESCLNHIKRNHQARNLSELLNQEFLMLDTLSKGFSFSYFQTLFCPSFFHESIIWNCKLEWMAKDSQVKKATDNQASLCTIHCLHTIFFNRPIISLKYSFY